jgi:hypothetical protein
MAGDAGRTPPDPATLGYPRGMYLCDLAEEGGGKA